MVFLLLIQHMANEKLGGKLTFALQMTSWIVTAIPGPIFSRLF
jgi:hypothetical protein